MSDDVGLVLLNFTKTITTPTSTIVFDDGQSMPDIKYIDLDVVVGQIITNAKEGDTVCQELLKQIVIEKFNNSELDEMLDLNAIVM